MSNFYTYVQAVGDNIYVRGFENGTKFIRKVPFSPTLYVPTKKDTSFKSIYDEPLGAVQPGSISDTREFIKSYKDVSNFKIHGMTNYVNQYITDNYPGDIQYDRSLMTILSIDIETTTEHGLTPSEAVVNPIEEITLITLVNANTKVVTTFGTRPWNPTDTDGPYILCNSEKQMLMEFLTFWTRDYPDIATGWNTDGYDFPYLIRRMNLIMGDEYSSKLSPWGRVREQQTHDKFGNDIIVYDIEGVSQLDYKDVFAKFSFIQVDDYKLDTVCKTVLDEEKLHNPEATFQLFYTNHWNLFVDYNRRDGVLVDRLDNKLKLIDLVLSMSYYSKINYETVFSPIALWDSIIYNFLSEQNIVIPPSEHTSKNESFEGAYVQEPVIGKHKWIASFDLASLYPHLIMQFNISPETIADHKIPCTVDELLNQTISTDYVKQENLVLSASGQLYRKDKRGFLPILMESMYNDRSATKKEMLAYEQKLQSDKDNQEYINQIAKLNSMQMALKILLNSLYGSLGNIHCRYFDIRMAESITLSGQLANRWNAKMLDNYFNKVNKTEGVQYVIAGDTDSNYLSMETLVENTCKDKSTEDKIKFMDKFCSDIITPMIDRSYQKMADYLNAYEQKMNMKREVLADSGVFIAKKKYFLRVHNSEGVQYDKPKIKVTGLELVKSSTPPICRPVMKDSIPVILDGDVTALKSYIADFKQKFMQFPVDEIAKPSGLNGMTIYKGTDKIYAKGTPIHVRGALLFNHHIKRLNVPNRHPIRDGDKVKFVFVRMPNPFQENVISFTDTLPIEFGLDYFIDRDTQFNKVFLDAMQIMVKPLGWNLDDSATLEDFFG